MYIIKKNGKRYNNKNYESYEQARSYIRKKLRPTAKEQFMVDWDSMGKIGESAGSACDWGMCYSNPSHSRYGFTITKVEQTTKKAA